MAVGDAHGYALLPGDVDVMQGQSLKQVEVDDVILTLTHQLAKQPGVVWVAQAAGQLHEADAICLQPGGEHALTHLGGDDVHLQVGPVHVQEHIVQKGLDAA